MSNNFQFFWGGEDVSPTLYGNVVSSYCGRPNKSRDDEEIALAKEMIASGIPCIGICRGAQLLNVINGGTLLQHIEGHAIGKMHSIMTYDKQELLTTSTHHQMMVPTTDAIILAWSPRSVMGIKNPVLNKMEEIETVWEVLYYPKTKCFCIQGHPEWMPKSSEFVLWLKKEIKERLNIDIDFEEKSSFYFGRI